MTNGMNSSRSTITSRLRGWGSELFEAHDLPAGCFATEFPRNEVGEIQKLLGWGLDPETNIMCYSSLPPILYVNCDVDSSAGLFLNPVLFRVSAHHIY